ncbi:hypothetical protein HYH02_004264 [Chlamydomonas schloesseri]|uniref:Exportin-4 n=1 Tax=Chlamydomonas schloesseri TaxID=2026947 RepID=A0A835WP98_9CHLO|nr:hypothetical protein HYH02_004264 [Chlamydomonas schloesseri]|eukprot:KAG2450992.1 hypothetical protein HYH02_004264 [Chlamydomonas schloesseri]
MDLDAAQAAVERACEEFKVPATAAAASAVLLQFRSSPGVLAACRHILDRSHSLDARFHAAAALRESVVRDWAALGTGPEGRTALRHYLLGYLAAAAEQPALQVVRSSLISALAVLLKRGWLEPGEGPASRAAFFQELEAATSQSAAARRVGVQVLEALVGEFAVSSASPLGLPLEHHAKCAADLQDHYLQGIFRHAVGLGRAAAQQHGDGDTCAACLTLMAAVLAWDFRRSASSFSAVAAAAAAAAQHHHACGGLHGAPGAGGGGGGGGLGGGGGGGSGLGLGLGLAAPSAGADWASLLLAPDTLDWVAGLLQQLTAAAAAPGAPAAARDLVARARGVVVALSNLSADVFPREGPEALTGPGGGVRGGYLRAVLRCVVAWVAAPRQVVAAAAAGDELPLWEACKALLALAAAHPPRLIQDAGNDVVAAAVAAGGLAPPPHGAGAGFLALLQALTLEVIRASCAAEAGGGGGGGLGGLEQWAVECRDMLVETWALMVQRDCGGAGLNPGLALSLAVGGMGPPTLPGLAEGAAAVFGALVEGALAAAGQGAEDDGDEDVAAENEAAEAAAEDARMAEAAALARAAPAATFPLLAGAMAAAQQQLLAAAAPGGPGAGSAPWAVALERLCWLVRMAAHCLADSGAGETPLMPLTLSIAVEAGGPALAAVEGLTAALLTLPALALQGGAAAVLSPRLMECVVWSLARWSDTYLFPEEVEGLPAALVASYGTRAGGAAGGVAAGSVAAAGGHVGPGVAPGQQAGGAGAGGGGGGGTGQAEAVVDGLARLAATCLVSFPGEAELHGMVCTVLLPVLSRRRPLCACLLEASPSWAELCGAFAARRPQLAAGLAPKLQRWLSQSLCQAACGFPSADSPHQPLAASPAGAYIANLLGPTAAEVRALAARPDLGALAARADVVAALCGMLEALRGGACRGAGAAGAAARAAGWALLSSELLGPLLALQRSAAGEDPRVSALLLKLAAAVVEHHVGYLQADQAHVLMSWVLELLRQYRSGRAARVSVAAAVAAGGSSGTVARRRQHPAAHSHHKHAGAPSNGNAAGAAALREDAAADAARELRALLSLLTHITQRDVALAAAASDGWASSAGSTPHSVNMTGGTGGVGGGGTPRGGGGGAGPGPGSSAGAEQESGVAQVVLTGLDVLLPLLTPELMAAATAAGSGDGGGGGGGSGSGGGPGGAGGKLSRLLFGLLAYMMEVHPHAVVALPPPHFATLLSCLEAGARGAAPQQGRAGSGAAASTSGGIGGSSTPVAAFDGVVVQSALEGLAGLAKYHHQSVMNGGRGFSGQCAPGPGPGPGGGIGGGGGPLGPYLVQLLLGICLLGDAGPDVVEQAGDALLPLLQSDPAAYASLGQALVQSSDPRVAGQVGAALAKLVSPEASSSGPAGAFHSGAAGGATAASDAAAAAVAAAGSSLGLDPRSLDLSRLSRRVFRERLCGVVAELRGLLRVR